MQMNRRQSLWETRLLGNGHVNAMRILIRQAVNPKRRRQAQDRIRADLGNLLVVRRLTDISLPEQ